MHDDCNIRIERHQNGYTVHITDPAIVKQNRERDTVKDGCCSVSWKDPQVSYAFSKKEEVVEFISKNIDKALPEDEYSSTFDKLVKDGK